ncbi:MAG: hypothetical protein CMN55_15860 [Sneathiella sp.]|jgi:MFS family permease|uniref:MFS transporter n=1 Tax=Sneathiella sp. TaxID=1964365 RepID=UPI000C5F5623|nr:MFS transporter [Sneathiella sp.]MAL80554.1 hypothetical protein [Sneathiella sp.]
MLHFQGTLLFVRQEWRFLLFGFLLAFWSGPGQTYVISVIGGEIRAAFLLTNSEFGLIYTLATLVCAALLWKAGPLVDYLPLKSITMKIGLMMVAALLAFGFVEGPISLFFGIIAIRFLGQGMMTHIALTSMARRYEAERGRAVAIAALGIPLGLAVYPPLIAVALGFVDWRFIWPGMAVLLAITLLPAIPFLVRASSRQEEGRVEADDIEINDIKHWTRREVLRDVRLYLLAPSIMIPAAVITGFFFHQVYLVETKGWNFDVWALSFSAFALAHIAGSVSLGFLVDMVGARRLAPFILMPMAIGIMLFAYVPSVTFAGVIMFCLGFGSGAVGPVLSTLWAEIYGTRHLGSIRSVVEVATVFGSALGPVFMGLALDQGLSVYFIASVSAGIAVMAAILAKTALIAR